MRKQQHLYSYDRRQRASINSRKQINRIPKNELFMCITKTYEPSTLTLSPYEQGIKFSDGTCRIGVDVWRDLDKHDCSSHSSKTLASIDEVMNLYWVIPVKEKGVV